MPFANCAACNITINRPAIGAESPTCDRCGAAMAWLTPPDERQSSPPQAGSHNRRVEVASNTVKLNEADSASRSLGMGEGRASAPRDVGTRPLDSQSDARLAVQGNGRQSQSPVPPNDPDSTSIFLREPPRPSRPDPRRRSSQPVQKRAQPSAAPSPRRAPPAPSQTGLTQIQIVLAVVLAAIIGAGVAWFITV